MINVDLSFRRKSYQYVERISFVFDNILRTLGFVEISFNFVDFFVSYEDEVILSRSDSISLDIACWPLHEFLYHVN